MGGKEEIKEEKVWRRRLQRGVKNAVWFRTVGMGKT